MAHNLFTADGMVALLREESYEYRRTHPLTLHARALANERRQLQQKQAQTRLPVPIGTKRPDGGFVYSTMVAGGTVASTPYLTTRFLGSVTNPAGSHPRVRSSFEPTDTPVLNRTRSQMKIDAMVDAMSPRQRSIYASTTNLHSGPASHRASTAGLAQAAAATQPTSHTPRPRRAPTFLPSRGSQTERSMSSTTASSMASLVSFPDVDSLGPRIIPTRYRENDMPVYTRAMGHQQRSANQKDRRVVEQLLTGTQKLQRRDDERQTQRQAERESQRLRARHANHATMTSQHQQSVEQLPVYQQWQAPQPQQQQTQPMYYVHQQAPYQTPLLQPLSHTHPSMHVPYSHPHPQQAQQAYSSLDSPALTHQPSPALVSHEDYRYRQASMSHPPAAVDEVYVLSPAIVTETAAAAAAAPAVVDRSPRSVNKAMASPHRRGTKSPHRRLSTTHPQEAHQQQHQHHHQPHRQHHHPQAHSQQQQHQHGHAHESSSSPTGRDAEATGVGSNAPPGGSSDLDQPLVEVDPHTLVCSVQADQTNRILVETKPWLRYDAAHTHATIHDEAEALLAEMNLPQTTTTEAQHHQQQQQQQRSPKFAVKPSGLGSDPATPTMRSPHAHVKPGLRAESPKQHHPHHAHHHPQVKPGLSSESPPNEPHGSCHVGGSPRHPAAGGGMSLPPPAATSHPLSRGPHHAPNNSISITATTHQPHPSRAGGHHAPNNSISFPAGGGGPSSFDAAPAMHRQHSSSIVFMADPIEEAGDSGFYMATTTPEEEEEDSGGRWGDEAAAAAAVVAAEVASPRRGGHHAPNNSIIFPPGTSLAAANGNGAHHAPSAGGKSGHHPPHNSLAFPHSSGGPAIVREATRRTASFTAEMPAVHVQPSSPPSSLPQQKSVQRSLTGHSSHGGTPQRVDSSLSGVQRASSHSEFGGVSSAGGPYAVGSLELVQAKFANVNALLDSALLDARSSPAAAAAAMGSLSQKRTGGGVHGTPVKHLHPAPHDGRSTGGSSVGVGGASANPSATRHTRRPSTSLVSSVVADEYENLVHESISDRLESNRLEIDPDYARKRAALLAKGPAPAPDQEREMTMAHWAQQIHQQILIEKHASEEEERLRLEEEEAKKQAAMQPQPPPTDTRAASDQGARQPTNGTTEER